MNWAAYLILVLAGTGAAFIIEPFIPRVIKGRFIAAIVLGFGFLIWLMSEVSRYG